MQIKVKSWFFDKVQEEASKYGRTLCWDRVNKGNAPSSERNPNDIYYFYGTLEKETEKAVFCLLDYWNLRKAGRYITDAPRETGWKAWIPKAAILNLNELQQKPTEGNNQSNQVVQAEAEPKVQQKKKPANATWFDQFYRNNS